MSASRPASLASVVLRVGAATALAACQTSTVATTYTPYTGIDVPTASVTAGVGCASPETDGGIDHYLAFLAPAAGAATPAAVPPSSITAAGSFACFTPAGTFESIDASATYDVWIFGFPAGLPSGEAVACDAGTCALNPASAWGAILYDLGDAGEVPTVALRCTAMGETGAHPFAYGCERVGGSAAVEGGVADADLADAGDAAPPDGGDGAPGDAAADATAD